MIYNRYSMILRIKVLTIFAAIYGFLAVALGAFGAHVLEKRLSLLGTTEVWKTAVDYQIWHTLAIFILAFSGLGNLATRISGTCFCLGIPLFSGSLYCLALGGPIWLGPITPIGGLSFMSGWVLTIFAILGKKK